MSAHTHKKVVMMGYIRDEDKKYLKGEFDKNLKKDVYLLVFVGDNCQYCSVASAIAQEVAELHPLIHFEEHRVGDDLAQEYGLEHAPTVVITDKDRYGGRIRYVGLPSGYEFSSMIEDIVDVSRRTAEVSEEVRMKLEKIDKPVIIQIFVTPTCPYCPRAVRTAHRFAILNENVTGEMVEAMEFPEWADRWKVMSVPHIVINEDVQFIGAYPDEQYIDYVVQAYEKTR
ncbi:Glutaredoxin-like domain protein [Aciduliprofundum sp. MAR08-339]|nr:Glutaredoxin-like domain protein [Aciduliprofundum sp. MAR08-339]